MAIPRNTHTHSVQAPSLHPKPNPNQNPNQNPKHNAWRAEHAEWVVSSALTMCEWVRCWLCTMLYTEMNIIEHPDVCEYFDADDAADAADAALKEWNGAKHTTFSIVFIYEYTPVVR